MLLSAGDSSILLAITDAGYGINSPEANKRVQQFFDMHLRGIKSEIPSEPAANIVPPQAAKK